MHTMPQLLHHSLLCQAPTVEDVQMPDMDGADHLIIALQHSCRIETCKPWHNQSQKTKACSPGCAAQLQCQHNSFMCTLTC